MRIFFVKLAAVIVAAGLALTGCPATTDPVDVPVTGVSLSTDKLTMGVNATATLTATVSPADATNKGVSWISSDTSIATVSNTGVVTSASAVTGTKTATITVTTNDGGKTAACTVTVDAGQTGVAVSEVQLSETTKTLNIGGTFTLTATVVPDEATNKTVTWSSDNTSVATVSTAGEVKAVAIGTARITAAAGGKSAVCTVTVNDPNASAQSLLDTGIDNLKGGYFDSALASFEAAFAKDVKGSATYTESVVYSSLAKLASLVKSQDLRKLLSDRTGVTGYPESIDELLRGDWMKDYVTDHLLWGYYDAGQWVSWYDAGQTWFFDYYKLPPQSGYYRQNLTLLSTVRKTGRIDYYQDETTGEWVNWYDNPSIGGGTAGYYYWKYESGNSQAVLVSTTEKTGDLDWYYDEEQKQSGSWYAEKNPAGYYYSDGTYSLVSAAQKYETNAELLPGLPVPEWFKDTNAYKDSLSVNDLKTPGTWELLLMANLLDRNSGGLNSLLDGVLSSVFGTAFEDAVARASLIRYEDSFKVGEDILGLLGVREIFDGDINIGKAELDLLFSALRVVKASLQWVSAYDWDTDLSFLKTEWNDLDGRIGELKPANLPFRNSFLKDRGNGRMTDSKESYITAIGTAIAAYDSMIAAKHLPQGVADELKKYDWIKDGLSKLKTAINDGSTFYVKEGSGALYSNDSSGALFGVNLGKFFTPGQFAINNLISTEGSGNSVAPKFFGMKGEGSGTPITAKEQINGYDMIGFEFKFASLEEVLVLGFDFPADSAVPLFPTYIAEHLYGLYH